LSASSRDLIVARRWTATGLWAATLVCWLVLFWGANHMDSPAAQLTMPMFDWSAAKLKLTQLTMIQGGATFQGTAETQEDGQLALKVSDGNKQIQTALKM